MAIHSPHQSLARNRQGALPLHLTLAMLPWLASNAALQLSKSGLSVSSAMPVMGASPAAAKLGLAWRKLLSDPKLAQAAEAEARKRAAKFLQGLSHYQKVPYERNVEEPACVLKAGAVRLLSYACDKPDAPVVFLIPSLINRYYILDLAQKISFARYLQGCGIQVYIVDWDTPSEHEKNFDCGLYVTQVLVPMAQWIRNHSGGPVILGGYCMGGLLSLALAQISPDLADGLALFAAPWDFFAPSFPRVAMQGVPEEIVSGYVNGRDLLPAETIHTLFHCANPYAFQNKISEFAGMNPDSPATQEFLAVEHWVNDGVAMTRGVARDCLIEWSQRNAPASGQWRVGGQVIDPRKLTLPCFIAAPQDDRIVPSDCARPLAQLLKHHRLVEPRSGHVGMMVGSRRKTGLWEPFTQWISGQFA